MSDKDKIVVNTVPSIGFLQILTIVFIILKLLGKITWSWWWVLAPLWIPVAFGLFLFILVMSILFICALVIPK